jgi:hypothetical protein
VSSRAPRRIRRNAPADPADPLLVQDLEKRELILAHAANRNRRPMAGWGLGYAAAVVAAIATVTTGWMLTFGDSFRLMAPPHRDQLLQTIDDSFAKHEAELDQGRDVIGNSVNAAKSTMNERQRALQEEALRATAAKIQADFRAVTSTSH